MIFNYLNTDQLKKTKQNPQTIFAASPCLRMYVYLFNLKNLFYHLQSRKTEDVRIYHMLRCGEIRCTIWRMMQAMKALETNQTKKDVYCLV